MLRLLRLTLTWLLVLALPAQGYAAQAMLFCGPMHSAAAFDSAATDHDHAAHGHGAPSSHAPQDIHPQGAPADADVQSADRLHASTGDTVAKADATGAGELSSAKCSVCASCCSMAAIAGALVVPETLSFPSVYTFSPSEPHASLAAGGLERPPKRLLA